MLCLGGLGDTPLILSNQAGRLLQALLWKILCSLGHQVLGIPGATLEMFRGL